MRHSCISKRFHRREWDDISDSVSEIKLDKLNINDSICWIDLKENSDDECDNDANIEVLESIFSIPKDVTPHRQIVKMWLSAVKRHCINDMLKYVIFFKDRGHDYDHNDLKYKSRWKGLESERVSINRIIMSNECSYCGYRKCTAPITRIIKEIIQRVISPERFDLSEEMLVKLFHKIESDVKDLIEWNISFVTYGGTLHPISYFRKGTTKLFNKYCEVEETILLVESKVDEYTSHNLKRKDITLQYVSEDLYDNIILKFIGL